MDYANISINSLTVASVFTVAAWSTSPNQVGVIIGQAQTTACRLSISSSVLNFSSSIVIGVLVGNPVGGSGAFTMYITSSTVTVNVSSWACVYESSGFSYTNVTISKTYTGTGCT